MLRTTFFCDYALVVGSTGIVLSTKHGTLYSAVYGISVFVDAGQYLLSVISFRSNKLVELC
jgi:hypothetical protein